MLAFDRSSVRTTDLDGRMHISQANISKAVVNPYLGREIPDFEILGLNAEKTYQLYRDPVELEKAAATFNNIPLLSEHVPVSADDHQPSIVVGSTGTDAVFESPYLKNSLVVWASDAIAGIDDDTQRELSSAYRYRADMTPGSFSGVRFDGVMRDIVGNHVALVETGRAGRDVIVGDSALKNKDLINNRKVFDMAMKSVTRTALYAQGALAAFLAPKLALDAKPDLSRIVAGLTAKNFKDQKKSIIQSVSAATAGKLAQDADLDGLVKLLDVLESTDVGDNDTAKDDEKPDASSAATSVDEDGASMVAKVKSFLTGKISDEDMAKIEAMMADDDDLAGDENKDDEDVEAKAKDAAPAPAAVAEKDKDMVSKPAMDAAIRAAVKLASDNAARNQIEIRNAEREVRPLVGDLALAFDSAESVYRAALKMRGVEGAETIHASALSALLKMLPETTKEAVFGASARVAMDADASDSFAKMYPNAARIGHA